MRKNDGSADYRIAVGQATHALKARDFSLSRSMIASAMAMNMDAPEPHNLLGILYELMGDNRSARQHYRAAYSLDPTYKPSCHNLERLAQLAWTPVYGVPDFGMPEDALKEEGS